MENTIFRAKQQLQNTGKITLDIYWNRDYNNPQKEYHANIDSFNLTN